MSTLGRVCEIDSLSAQLPGLFLGGCPGSVVWRSRQLALLAVLWIGSFGQVGCSSSGGRCGDRLAHIGLVFP